MADEQNEEARRFGYIHLSRKFQDHRFWKEPRTFSRAEAWIDLLLSAAWKEREVLVGGQAVTLQRGEVLASERFLAKRWGWTRGRATRFLLFLQKAEQVNRKPGHAAAHTPDVLVILNYDTYQSVKGGTEPRSEPRASHERATSEPRTEPNKKKGKQVEEGKAEETESGAVPAADAATPPILVFPCIGSGGQEWGLTPAQLNEWRELYPGMDVLAAVRHALAWVRADLKRRKTTSGMLRFLVGWLNRAANNSHRSQSPSREPVPNRRAPSAAASEPSSAVIRWNPLAGDEQ